MIRSATAKWYYTDEVYTHTQVDPQSINDKKLPRWPVSRADAFFAVGIRF